MSSNQFKGSTESWEVVEHNWSDTSIISGDYTVCTKSIEGESWSDEEGEEEHNQKLEDTASADFRLIGQSLNMLKAMQKFCERVEKGEVRSTKTYNEFKEIIKAAIG